MGKSFRKLPRERSQGSPHTQRHPGTPQPWLSPAAQQQSQRVEQLAAPTTNHHRKHAVTLRTTATVARPGERTNQHNHAWTRHSVPGQAEPGLVRPLQRGGEPSTAGPGVGGGKCLATRAPGASYQEPQLPAVSSAARERLLSGEAVLGLCPGLETAGKGWPLLGLRAGGSIAAQSQAERRPCCAPASLVELCGWLREPALPWRRPCCAGTAARPGYAGAAPAPARSMG